MSRRNISPKREECPECGNQVLIRDHRSGEVVCSFCGYVISRELSRGPEWRAFTPREIQKRTRVSPKTDSFRLINPRDRDAFGRKISSSERLKMYRLRRLQLRSSAASQRNLNLAKAELDRLCSLLHVPAIIREEAMRIYLNVLKRRLIRGRAIRSIVAASLFIACRKYQIPRSLAAISEKSPIDKKGVGRDVRFLLRRLGLRLPVHEQSIYIQKVGGNLGLSQKTQERALQILQEAQKKGITAGKDPRGQAAATLYIACTENKENRTQKDIAKESGVTEVTVRNRYKQLVEELKLDVNLRSRKFKITDDIQDYIQEVGRTLDLPMQTRERAFQILYEAQEKSIAVSYETRVLALIALYVACLEDNEKNAGARIVKISGVSSATFSNRHRQLVEKLNLDINVKDKKAKPPDSLLLDEVSQDLELSPKPQ